MFLYPIRGVGECDNCSAGGEIMRTSTKPVIEFFNKKCKLQGVQGNFADEPDYEIYNATCL